MLERVEQGPAPKEMAKLEGAVAAPTTEHVLAAISDAISEYRLSETRGQPGEWRANRLGNYRQEIKRGQTELEKQQNGSLEHKLVLVILLDKLGGVELNQLLHLKLYNLSPEYKQITDDISTATTSTATTPPSHSRVGNFYSSTAIPVFHNSPPPHQPKHPPPSPVPYDIKSTSHTGRVKVKDRSDSPDIIAKTREHVKDLLLKSPEYQNALPHVQNLADAINPTKLSIFISTMGLGCFFPRYGQSPSSAGSARSRSSSSGISSPPPQALRFLAEFH